MSVRAKFRVEEIAKNIYATRIKLGPVTSGSEENKAFFKATPVGSIEIGTVNDEAASQFTVGAEFYIDFTPATAA